MSDNTDTGGSAGPSGDTDPQKAGSDSALSVLHVQNAIRRPSPTPPEIHLWDADHPFYGADGTAGDETHFDTFDALRRCLNNHPHDGSTVIYRWDWHKPDLIDPPHGPTPATFSVYGLFPRNGHLFVLSCPISDHQEPDVLEWLRGPRMLGALQALWAPLLDTHTPVTPAQEP